jgi:hypothetical protein
MVVMINRERREVPESPFVSLLLAIGAHLRSPKSWSSREALRIPPSRAAMARIRAPFAGLVPAGFDAVEVDGQKACRLNPGIVMERVDWGAMVDHPNANVRRVAKEMLAKGG